MIDQKKKLQFLITFLQELFNYKSLGLRSSKKQNKTKLFRYSSAYEEIEVLKLNLSRAMGSIYFILFYFSSSFHDC